MVEPCRGLLSPSMPFMGSMMTSFDSRIPEDSPQTSSEENERELDRAFREATEAADAAWEKGLLTPESIEASIRHFRARHPYHHDQWDRAKP